ncbi:MAG: hypothetical protein NTV00_05885 [Methylococcales bacterium]|nr:hypothetical protein [Methylococcales bacterium]
MISQTLPSALPARHYPSRADQAQGGRFNHSPDAAANNRQQSTVDQYHHLNQQGQNPAAVASSTENQKVARLATQDLSTVSKSSFSMQFTTKEGDVVTIGFKAANENHQSSATYQDGNVTASGYQASSKQSTEFNVSVEGDLNDAEKKSLSDLMQQMQSVGEKFFTGDSKAAFQQAQKMGFDTEQIAGYSMSLNMEKSVRAVSTYQQISDQKQPVDSNTLKKAGDFYNQADQALSGKTDSLQRFAEPDKAFNDLAKGIIDAVASQFKDQPNIDQQADTLKKIMALLNAKAQPAPEPAKAAPVQEPTTVAPTQAAETAAAAPTPPSSPFAQ